MPNPEKTESESTKLCRRSRRVQKEDKDFNQFDHICVVLENEGYHVWSQKLRKAVGLSK